MTSQEWGWIYSAFLLEILGLPDVKSQLTGKNLDAEKNWRQKEKGTTEDEMVREHHWLNGHESEQTLADSEGQESLGVLQSVGSPRVGHIQTTIIL